MRLKECFITQIIDDQLIMVATDNSVFKGIIKSNETAAFIIDILKQDTSRDSIISTILDIYNVDEETATKDVNCIIEQLRSIGAIDE